MRLHVAIRIANGTGRVLEVKVTRKGETLPSLLPTSVNEAFTRGETEPQDGDSRWVVRVVTEEGDL